MNLQAEYGDNLPICPICTLEAVRHVLLHLVAGDAVSDGVKNALAPVLYAVTGALVTARVMAEQGGGSAHLGGDEEIVCAVKADPEAAQVSPKMKALLAIAAKVQRDGKEVRTEDIERAKKEGASDLEIHDTVLIAAVFCMCNRYVDGLATWAPTDPAFYRDRAAEIAKHGYAASTIPELAAASV